MLKWQLSKDQTSYILQVLSEWASLIPAWATTYDLYPVFFLWFPPSLFPLP